jgi:putative oxidoreductase
MPVALYVAPESVLATLIGMRDAHAPEEKGALFMLKDFGLLALRGVSGGLFTGHGGQKLFAWFDGPGLEGTTGMMDSMGLNPPKPWATMAGGSEFAGGVLTTLGLLHPIGPILKLGPMLTAIRQMHWKTPIWATEGGAELPLTNIAIAVALATQHPGKLSLDHLLGIKVPGAVTLAMLAGVVAGLVMSEIQTASDDEQEETSTEAT